MSDPYKPYRTSTRTDGAGNCVEVADAVNRSGVKVRDSKDRTGPELTFGAAGWVAFLEATKDGAFDLI